MGGTIAMTIREPDGTEHRMARWTNPIPDFINNLGFINKDPEHLAKYQSQWMGMRKDWLDHIATCTNMTHGDCKFLYPMTPCYAPTSELAPDGYGLIVIDMQKDVIISCQGYCAIGNFLLGKYISGNEEWEWAQNLLDAGKILSVESMGKPVKVPKKINNLKKKQFTLTLKVDLSPFKVIKVSEGDYKALKLEVLKLGFTLSPEEEQLWDKAIKESVWE